ncbi:MAG: SAM-dependent methyltransferase [Candidatus Cloacimonadota bacterium]|nr:MAG: SAM-dependent methyltransferase [Candidatus Cloacimonadota bacterium]PIE78509.1 MAG: SAM-dependent methyltransferase [Candidatus Delongbacteria bacterium]
MRENPFNIYTTEYENWFKKNDNLFRSELLCLKKLIPIEKRGVEIGVGSGIFAKELGIRFGIDPSENMLKLAEKRGIKTDCGFAENLPYKENSFDFAVFITSLCFITDPLKAFKEAYRIVHKKGSLIVAFIDKNSFLGRTIESEKSKSKFYKNAKLYSTKEVVSLMEESNFVVTDIFQTLTNIKNIEIEEPTRGFGEGSFVVIRGESNQI